MESDRVYAIYSRKSKYTGKGESIENQIEMCRRYIADHFGQEAADNALVFEDEGFSGKNTNRPQYQKMMKAVQKGNIQAIVCYRLDRMTRSVRDCADLVEELECYDTVFVSLKENFDLSTPIGKAMFNIVITFAQLERETIAERIKDNLHELAKTGRWLGGITPTGYKSTGETKVTVDGKKRNAFHLQIVPEEAQLVKLIFTKLLELKTQSKVLTYLLNHNYKTKNGKKFTRFSIRAIVSNPVYARADDDMYEYLTACGVNLFSEKSEFDGTYGIMTYNRTDQQTGKTTKIKPMEEWVVSVGRHEGIVSGKDWIAVQNLLTENKEKGKNWNKGKRNVALLSGLLFCRCGDYMRPKISDRKTPEGEAQHTYMCTTKADSKRGKCNNKNIANGNWLDKAICFEIKKLAEDESELNRRLKAGKQYFVGEDNQLAEDLERLRKAEQETEKEADAFMDTLARVAGTPAEQRIVKRINELDSKVKSIHENIEDLEKTLQAKELQSQEFDLLRDVLKSFAATMDNMSVEQKRIAIRTIIKRIVWDGDKIHIYLFGDDEGTDGENIDFPPPDDMEGENKSADSNQCVQTPHFGEDSK